MKFTGTHDASPLIGFDRKTSRTYKGMRIMADPSLHEQLAKVIDAIAGELQAAGTVIRVLDLGCGEGALAQRLHDAGYDVVAADVDQVRYRATGPVFRQLDLDDQEAVERFVDEFKGSFDVILAVEIVEHVRDPWRFISNLRSLCRRSSHILVTTPNISSWWARFMFLLTGNLWGFDDDAWSQPGHINPLGDVEMRGILRTTGFRLKEVFPCGKLPVIWLYNWKRAIISVFMLPVYFAMRGQKRGWALCYHARPVGDASSPLRPITPGHEVNG